MFSVEIRHPLRTYADMGVVDEASPAPRPRVQGVSFTGSATTDCPDRRPVLSAWIGLVPKQHLSGGKDKLGSISEHHNAPRKEGAGVPGSA